MRNGNINREAQWLMATLFYAGARSNADMSWNVGAGAIPPPTIQTTQVLSIRRALLDTISMPVDCSFVVE